MESGHPSAAQPQPAASEASRFLPASPVAPGAPRARANPCGARAGRDTSRLLELEIQTAFLGPRSAQAGSAKEIRLGAGRSQPLGDRQGSLGKGFLPLSTACTIGSYEAARGGWAAPPGAKQQVSASLYKGRICRARNISTEP